MPDGARMVAVLQPLEPDEYAVRTGEILKQGETGLVMALPKMSFARPQDSIYIRRAGYRYASNKGISIASVVIPDEAIERLKQAVCQKWITGDFVRFPRENQRSADNWFLHDVADAMGLDSGRGITKARASASQLAVRAQLQHSLDKLTLGENSPFEIRNAKQPNGRVTACIAVRESPH